MASGESSRREKPTRVIACFGGMVIVSGMERMSFEVLRVLKENGAAIHCILNSWESHRIQRLVEMIGASSSTGFYWYRLSRHSRNPWHIAQMVWDVLATSYGLVRDALRLRATHVFLPEHVSVLRNAPALLLLRMMGKRVVVRLANHPDSGRFYSFLWRFVMPPLATVFVQISDFSRRRALEVGLPARKMTVIKNRVPRRPPGTSKRDPGIVELVRRRKTLLVVGQIAPFKGTHLAVEAALELLEEGWDLQLVVLGRKPDWPQTFVEYYEAMQARAASSAVRDRILFPGECENVLEAMRESYLLLAPILQEETFGTALLEAKSAGLPVVAFRRGGIVEQVEHGVTGHLCDDVDLPPLLAGIRRFLERPDERARASEASLASLRAPDSEFSPDVFERKWLEVFSMQQTETTFDRPEEKS